MYIYAQYSTYVHNIVHNIVYNIVHNVVHNIVHMHILHLVHSTYKLQK